MPQGLSNALVVVVTIVSLTVLTVLNVLTGQEVIPLLTTVLAYSLSAHAISSNKPSDIVHSVKELSDMNTDARKNGK